VFACLTAIHANTAYPQSVTATQLFEMSHNYFGPYNNPEVHLHGMLTDNPTEVSDIQNSSSSSWFVTQRALVFTQPAAGLVALYRYYNRTKDDHFFTTDFTEGALAVNYLDYTLEGICCWVSPIELPGGLALYRILSGTQHIYTTDPDYAHQFIAPDAGGQIEAIEGWVWPINAIGSAAPSLPVGKPGVAPGVPLVPKAGEIYATPLYIFFGNHSRSKLELMTDNQNEAYDIKVHFYQGLWKNSNIPSVMVFNSMAKDLVPLYRYYDPNSQDHFYTIDDGEIGNSPANKKKFIPEGVCCYISKVRLPGTVQLLRATDGHTHQYIPAEDNQVSSYLSPGFRFESIVGYVWIAPTGVDPPPLLPLP